ncbi:DUF4097 family beta strand repeat-containing protein [Streptomyces zingiberis]|uniref:DUF4097 domain-containing protein n=1 Tax=Streptomyces zingiberis TaxID=2053010 RepID=A0ABX1BY28_9ACTN|nr:DUF4097 family beta strand repeat-containing protein [Streptomyces zingiberis]NJP99568.1 DUF4097 domain-containing protein [Streptomyces zingiberis]
MIPQHRTHQSGPAAPVSRRSHDSRVVSGPRRRAVFAAGGVLVLVAGLSGCGADAGEDGAPERRSFAFSGKTLTIDAGNTSLDLLPDDGKGAGDGDGKAGGDGGASGDVRVTRWFSGWSALGGGVKQVWEMKGNTLRLDTDCQGLIDNCDSRHEVRVPRGVAVVVNGDNGSVTATGFDTGLSLTTGNGSVRVRDVSGALRLETDNGKVKGTGVTSRQVSATANNGSVEVGFRSVPGRVDTVTDNGSISLGLPDAAYRVETRTGNGRVDVSVDRDSGSAHHITARTGNGRISIQPAD